MKGTVLIFVSLLGLTAFAKPDPELLKKAVESATTCSNFVSYDDQNVYLGFGPYRHMWEEPRQAIPGSVTVVPIEAPAQRFAISTADAALGTITVGQTLYILTYTGIEEWDLSSRTHAATYKTIGANGLLAYQEHAQAFARLGDKIIIAHGRLGVSFFDLKTKRLTNQFRLVEKQSPLESMATGVTIVGDLAYVVMDNFSLVPIGKPAFRGLVVIDMKTEKVVRELDGLDPFATSLLSDGTKLIVSFDGMIMWRYSLSSLNGAQMPEPMNRVWRFPLKGEASGRASMDEKYIYTCFKRAPDAPGGHYKFVPMALDRRVLMLD